MEKPNLDNWKKNQTLILIRELQKHAELYNPLDQHYTNKVKKNNAYLSILEEVNKVKENVTVPDIKKKIKTLQTQLSKEKAKIRNSKRSGAGTDEVFEPKLWCYNELSFLNNITDSEPSESTIDLTKFGIESAEEATENIKIPENIKTQKKRQREEAESNLDKNIEDILLSAKCLTDQNKKSAKTKEEQFCELLCTLLQTLKSENSFNELTVEIFQLVTNKVKDEKEKLQQKELFQFNKRRIQASSTPTPSTSASSDFSQYPTLFYISDEEDIFY